MFLIWIITDFSLDWHKNRTWQWKPWHFGMGNSWNSWRETGHFKQQKITTVSGSKRSCLPSKMRFTLPANWGDKIIQDHTRSPCRDVLKQWTTVFFGSLPMKGRPSSDLASSPRTQHLGFDPICHTLSSNCAWMLDIFWLVVLNMAQLTRPKTMESHHALHG